MPERNALATLAGQAAPLLLAEVEDRESIQYNSFFHPREWTKCTPHVCDEVVISPSNPFAFGIDCNFQYCKSAALIKDASLRIVAAPNTVTSSDINPPGPAYYVDWLGYAFIKKMVMSYGSNTLYDLDKYDLYFRSRWRHTRETIDAIADCVLGDATTAERTQALVNGTTLEVPLDLPFSRSTYKRLPVVSLSQKLQFTLTSEEFSNLIVRGVGSNAVVTPNTNWQVFLVLQVVHLSGAEVDHFLQMTNHMKGLTYMIAQSQRQRSTTFANSQNNVSLQTQITGVNRAIKLITFALLPSHLQDNTGRNDYFMFNPQPPLPLPPGPPTAGMTPYNPILSWSLEATGLIIQRIILEKYNRVYQRMQKFPSPHGEFIYHQSYAMYPLAEDSSSGFQDYNNLPTPTLILNFGVGGTGVDSDNPANPQTLVLILQAEDINFWYVNRGNFSRSFN